MMVIVDGGAEVEAPLPPVPVPVPDPEPVTPGTLMPVPVGIVIEGNVVLETAVGPLPPEPVPAAVPVIATLRG